MLLSQMTEHEWVEGTLSEIAFVSLNVFFYFIVFFIYCK